MSRTHDAIYAGIYEAVREAAGKRESRQLFGGSALSALDGIEDLEDLEAFGGDDDLEDFFDQDDDVFGFVDEALEDDDAEDDDAEDDGPVVDEVHLVSIQEQNQPAPSPVWQWYEEDELDLLPDSMDSELAAQMEIESQAQDLAIQQELEDVAAEEAAQQVLVQDVMGSTGRRLTAQRARTALQSPGKDSFQTGYGAGYVAALRDLGIDEQQIKEQFGIFKILGAAMKGALGGAKLTDVAQALGAGARERALASMESGEEAEEGPKDSVQSDRSTLPPVYVADEIGFEEDADRSMPNGKEAITGLKAEERFGAVCGYGLVQGQARTTGRKAAHRAVTRATNRLAKIQPGRAEPLVEDPTAKPVLYASGRVIDPVYGELTAVPCPSCTRTQRKSAAYGAAQQCVVCEGYGALLLPSEDLPAYHGGHRYGFFMALTPLIKLLPDALKEAQAKTDAETQAAIYRPQPMPSPEGPSEIDSFREKVKAKRLASASPVVQKNPEAFGAVRALVPESWWKDYCERTR